MKMYSQRDPKWAHINLGNSNSSIGNFGCFLTCLSMLVEKTPPEVNEILKKAGAFMGDLIVSDKAAKALGLEYYGKEENINNVPEWYPNIKEVDMSPAPGKQQHFVVRIMENGKKKIVDPWTGKVESISKYPFVSYRKFKVKNVICNHSCAMHCN